MFFVCFVCLLSFCAITLFKRNELEINNPFLELAFISMCMNYVSNNPFVKKKNTK